MQGTLWMLIIVNGIYISCCAETDPWSQTAICTEPWVWWIIIPPSVNPLSSSSLFLFLTLFALSSLSFSFSLSVLLVISSMYLSSLCSFSGLYGVTVSVYQILSYPCRSLKKQSPDKWLKKRIGSQWWLNSCMFHLLICFFICEVYFVHIRLPYAGCSTTTLQQTNPPCFYLQHFSLSNKYLSAVCEVMNGDHPSQSLSIW